MIWPWLMTCEEETPPPTLEEAISDGLELWGEWCELPVTTRAAVEDIFLLRRLCSCDKKRFQWIFRGLVRKAQWRYKKLAWAEACEYNPFITNIMQEESDRETHASDTHTATSDGDTTMATFDTESTEGGQSTRHSDTAETSTLSTVREEGRSRHSGSEHSAELGSEEGSSARQESGHGEKTSVTDRVSTGQTDRSTEGTKEGRSLSSEAGSSAQSETGTTTRSGEKASLTEGSDRDTSSTAETTSTARAGTEASTQETSELGGGQTAETKTAASVRGESGSTSHRDHEENGLSADYSRTSAVHEDVQHKKFGTEVKLATQDAGFSRASETQHLGTETRQSSTADVTSMYPEQDSGAVISALQEMAAGTIAQPALTYATAGTFHGESERSGYDGRSDRTTETRTGSTYDVTGYGEFGGIPGITTAPRSDHDLGDTTTTQTGVGKELKDTTAEERTATDSSEHSGETTSRTDSTTKASRGGSEKAETSHEDSAHSTGSESAKTTTSTVSESEAASDESTKATTGHTESQSSAQTSDRDTSTERSAETGTEATSGSDTEATTRAEESVELRSRSGETSRGSEEESEDTRGSETTGGTSTTSGGSAETSTIGTRRAEGGSAQKTTGTSRDEAYRVGLEAATRILSGRSGMSPQALLAEYEAFVLNSRALEWLCEQLEPAFWQIERSL